MPALVPAMAAARREHRAAGRDPRRRARARRGRARSSPSTGSTTPSSVRGLRRPEEVDDALAARALHGAAVPPRGLRHGGHRGRRRTARRASSSPRPTTPPTSWSRRASTGSWPPRTRPGGPGGGDPARRRRRARRCASRRRRWWAANAERLSRPQLARRGRGGLRAVITAPSSSPTPRASGCGRRSRSCSGRWPRRGEPSELIVVDNGDNAAVLADFDGVEVLRPGTNVGFAGRRGARARRDARGEWVALVNDDAELEPGARARAAGRRPLGRRRRHASPARCASWRARTRSTPPGWAWTALGVAYDRLAGAPAIRRRRGRGGLRRERVRRALPARDAQRRRRLRPALLRLHGGRRPGLAGADGAAGARCTCRRAVAYHHGSATAGEASDFKYHLVGRNRMRMLARNATRGQLIRWGWGDGALRPRVRDVRRADRPHARPAARPPRRARATGACTAAPAPAARRPVALDAPTGPLGRLASAQGLPEGGGMKRSCSSSPPTRSARHGRNGASAPSSSPGRSRRRMDVTLAAPGGGRRAVRAPAPDRAAHGPLALTDVVRRAARVAAAGAAGCARSGARWSTTSTTRSRSRCSSSCRRRLAAPADHARSRSTACSTRCTTAMHFLCASETQRDLWTGTLLAEGLLRPAVYDRDPSLGRAHRDRAVRRAGRRRRSAGPGPRERFGLADDDEIVLWNGGLWDWLDPETAIDAVARCALPAERCGSCSWAPRALAGPRRRRASPARAASSASSTRSCSSTTAGSRTRSAARGSLEADCALSTHVDHLETRFAFRTRLLDCFWAGAARRVHAAGTNSAARVERDGLGAAVAPSDPGALADALVAVLERGRPAFADALAAAADAYRWTRVAQPLRDLLPGPLPPRLGHGAARRPSQVARGLAMQAAVVGLRVAGRPWPSLG